MHTSWWPCNANETGAHAHERRAWSCLAAPFPTSCSFASWGQSTHAKPHRCHLGFVSCTLPSSCLLLCHHLVHVDDANGSCSWLSWPTRRLFRRSSWCVMRIHVRPSTHSTRRRTSLFLALARRTVVMHLPSDKKAHNHEGIATWRREARRTDVGTSRGETRRVGRRCEGHGRGVVARTYVRVRMHSDGGSAW